APHVNTQQAGIVAYSGDDDYLKLDWEFGGGVARLNETSEDSLSGAPVVQVLTTIPTAPIFGTRVDRVAEDGQEGAAPHHVVLDQRHRLSPRSKRREPP
ncbi:MAG TPA: hypothetical protein VF087_15230, partial [Solirubrobacteraceae bacterium]